MGSYLHCPHSVCVINVRGGSPSPTLSQGKKWPCQNLDYKILVTKQWLGPHWDGIPAPEMVCIVKTNKNGVRGSQASKSPAVWPPDPNLLAEPGEADKPRWLQTVGSTKGNNASSRAAAPEQEGRKEGGKPSWKTGGWEEGWRELLTRAIWAGWGRETRFVISRYLDVQML